MVPRAAASFFILLASFSPTLAFHRSMLSWSALGFVLLRIVVTDGNGRSSPLTV
jgi:hypothetical protein